MFYPKIHSLYKREGWYFEEKLKNNTTPELQSRRQSFIIGDYACPEFESINRWQVDEKIDGTNIRIFWNPQNPVPVMFGGRTDNAQLPTKLLMHLTDTFTKEKLEKCFGDKSVVLFGEGYGPKIQACGGRYRNDISFILFDVVIARCWLEKDSVIDIACQLGIEHTINQQIMSTSEIVDFVRSHPQSYISKDPTLVMEGVIARSYPLMLFRHAQSPVMFKLKVRDFPDT